jgi:alkylation response protein AidB-like acyl-CoA dehydrogenase
MAKMATIVQTLELPIQISASDLESIETLRQFVDRFSRETEAWMREKRRKSAQRGRDEWQEELSRRLKEIGYASMLVSFIYNELVMTHGEEWARDLFISFVGPFQKRPANLIKNATDLLLPLLDMAKPNQSQLAKRLEKDRGVGTAATTKKIQRMLAQLRRSEKLQAALVGAVMQRALNKVMNEEEDTSDSKVSRTL